MKSEPERSMVKTSASPEGSDSIKGGMSGIAMGGGAAATGAADKALAGAASVAAPAATLFRKFRRSTSGFVDFVMELSSALGLGRSPLAPVAQASACAAFSQPRSILSVKNAQAEACATSRYYSPPCACFISCAGSSRALIQGVTISSAILEFGHSCERPVCPPSGFTQDHLTV